MLRTISKAKCMKRPQHSKSKMYEAAASLKTKMHGAAMGYGILGVA